MAKFTDEILEIFANCIAGVESGGQIYGNGKWDCLILQYTNSKNEHAITIGAYQRMGVMAKGLLERIRKEYPTVFWKYDKAGIGEDMEKYPSWAAYQLSSTTCPKAKAIKEIISTPEGIRIQKKLMAEESQSYSNKIEQDYGIHRIDALLHLANVQHLGGSAPLERIISRISGEVTLEKVRDSLLQDRVYNQVGADPYRERQALMYKWIHEKITPLLDAKGLVREKKKEVKPMGVTAKQVIAVMESWIGMDRAKGTHKPIIDTYNSYIKSHPGAGRSYCLTMKDEYCDGTVSAAFIKLNAVDLIGGVECGVEEHINIFKKKDIWNEDGTITPAVGNIICYNWDDATQPNDGYADHIGIVKSVDKTNRTFTVIEGNMNGKVGTRTIPFGWGYIRGYAIPKYAAESEGSVDPAKQAENTATNVGKVGTCKVTLKTFLQGAQDDQIKAIQILLNAKGYKGKDGKVLTVDGALGTNTEYAITKLQKDAGMKNINFGSVAGKTWELLLA